MTLPAAWVGPSLWAEIEGDVLNVSNGTSGQSIPLGSRPDGRLDSAVQATVLDALQHLAPRSPWQTRGVLWCALSAKGVSLKRISLPVSKREDLRRILTLQVEARFPLPPDALAWGWFEPAPNSTTPSPPGLTEVTVAAIRKETLEPLAAVFTRAGFQPVFTLASSVRHPDANPSGTVSAVIHLGRHHSEWLAWEGFLPAVTRSIAWGEETFLEELGKTLTQDRATLSERFRAWVDNSGPTAGADARFREAAEAALAPLLESIQSIPQKTRDGGEPETWLLDGPEPVVSVVAAVLRSRHPGRNVAIQPETARPAGSTAAVEGLRSWTQSHGGTVPIRLDLSAVASVLGSKTSLARAHWVWVARAAALLAALLLFPYAEALLGRPLVARRLAALQKDRDRLNEIDRRLGFVDQLVGSQPPYVDALFVIANAAPQGARVESVNMNRRGEVSLSGFTQMPQQAVDFRTRLVDSKFFSNVVVEEQAPAQGGPQKVNLRITAQWKGPAEREALQLGPVLPEAAKTNSAGAIKTNATPATSGNDKTRPVSKPDSKP